mmetsp:Transcript_24108/g.36539  ORF Transcript_24108/g.36539 Transcript_24108/m.36539 type:complete len:95 (-) Transcript_24108:66-350(-)
MHTKRKHTTENHTKIKHTKEKHCTGYLFDFVRTKKDDHLHHEYLSQVVGGDDKKPFIRTTLHCPVSFAFIPHISSLPSIFLMSYYPPNVSNVQM